MNSTFKSWLQSRYSPTVAATRLSNVTRIEEHYGDLEDALTSQSLDDVADSLKYSKADLARNAPNPSKIPIRGDIYEGLATLRSALALYRKFLGEERGSSPEIAEPAESPLVQRLGLETDLQKALRRDIRRLASTLKITDDGAERSVASGLIDITCIDESDGALVVIELKAGCADRRAIGQVLGYIGDISAEEQSKQVRGILVAHEFDKAASAAATVVPQLRLVRYSVDFSFVHQS